MAVEEKVGEWQTQVYGDGSKFGEEWDLSFVVVK